MCACLPHGQCRGGQLAGFSEELLEGPIVLGGKSLWVHYFQGILTGKRTHHCQHVRSGLCCMLRLLCAPPLIGMFNLQTQHTNEERSCLLPASVCAL